MKSAYAFFAETRRYKVSLFFWAAKVGLYKVQQVRVYKVSLFFGFGKWVFIRSIFFYFDMVSLFSNKPVYAFFAKTRQKSVRFEFITLKSTYEHAILIKFAKLSVWEPISRFL